MYRKIAINKHGVPTEALEQEFFFKYVDAQYIISKDERYLMIFAIPTGGSRHILEAVNLKRQGVKKGIPDIFVDFPSGSYHGLRIEMKPKKGAHHRPEQKEIIERYNSLGYKAVVCYGADEAIKVLEEYFKGVKNE